MRRSLLTLRGPRVPSLQDFCLVSKAGVALPGVFLHFSVTTGAMACGGPLGCLHAIIQECSELPGVEGVEMGGQEEKRRYKKTRSITFLLLTLHSET